MSYITLKPNFLALAVLAGLSFSAQAEFIVNGTFDTNAAGWTLSDEPAYNAGGWVDLNGGGQNWKNPKMSQTVTGLEIGTTYVIRWDQYQIDAYGYDNYGPSLGVFLGSDTNNPLALTWSPYIEWHSFEAMFTATSTSQLITFAAELDPRTPGISHINDVAYSLDNISLRAPEPSALALLGISLVGMLGLGKRKLM